MVIPLQPSLTFLESVSTKFTLYFVLDFFRFFYCQIFVQTLHCLTLTSKILAHWTIYKNLRSLLIVIKRRRWSIWFHRSRHPVNVKQTVKSNLDKNEKQTSRCNSSQAMKEKTGRSSCFIDWRSRFRIEFLCFIFSLSEEIKEERFKGCLTCLSRNVSKEGWCKKNDN